MAGSSVTMHQDKLSGVYQSEAQHKGLGLARQWTTRCNKIDLGGPGIEMRSVERMGGCHGTLRA